MVKLNRDILIPVIDAIIIVLIIVDMFFINFNNFL